MSNTKNNPTKDDTVRKDSINRDNPTIYCTSLQVDNNKELLPDNYGKKGKTANDIKIESGTIGSIEISNVEVNNFTKNGDVYNAKGEKIGKISSEKAKEQFEKRKDEIRDIDIKVKNGKGR